MSRNDNRASFFKIGLAVSLGVAAIVATLIYIGGIWGNDDRTLIETYYDRGVSGLSVGSVVNFRGVKVGEVSEIGFVGSRYGVDGPQGGKVYIEMAINNGTIGIRDDNHDGECEDEAIELLNFMVQHGLHATVTSSGITGLSRVELDFIGKNETIVDEKPSWTPRNIFVPAKMSLLDNFSDSATKVMNQINKMDLVSTWSNVAVAVEALSRAMDGAKVMIETRQGDIEKIVDAMTETATSLSALSADLRRNPSLLIRERQLKPLPETER